MPSTLSILLYAVTPAAFPHGLLSSIRAGFLVEAVWSWPTLLCLVGVGEASLTSVVCLRHLPMLFLLITYQQNPTPSLRVTGATWVSLPVLGGRSEEGPCWIVVCQREPPP